MLYWSVVIKSMPYFRVWSLLLCCNLLVSQLEARVLTIFLLYCWTESLLFSSTASLLAPLFCSLPCCSCSLARLRTFPLSIYTASLIAKDSIGHSYTSYWGPLSVQFTPLWYCALQFQPFQRLWSLMSTSIAHQNPHVCMDPISLLCSGEIIPKQRAGAIVGLTLETYFFSEIPVLCYLCSNIRKLLPSIFC